MDILPRFAVGDLWVFESLFGDHRNEVYGVTARRLYSPTSHPAEARKVRNSQDKRSSCYDVIMVWRVVRMILASAVVVLPQVNRPTDNTKIFGAPPPAKVDKNLLRTVTGVVKDLDGNPVEGAIVYLKDLKTGKERGVAAGPNGNFQFEDLHKANDYQLRAVKDRLESAVKTLSNFDTRLKPVMNLTLEPKVAAPVEQAGKK
jgi:hypothetical protein